MNRAGYVDAPSGASGDMILGALVDAGLAIDDLRAMLSRLPLADYTLSAQQVRRGALGATLVRVIATEAQPPHRGLGEIREIIAAGSLPEAVQANALHIFERLAAAEARVHRVPIEEIHFHEVGAVDAIVDIVGACIGLHLLGIEDLFASPLPLARGATVSAHGALPLPAPAVLELLAERSVPTIPHPSPLELVTPTGAAILSTLARFEQPALRLGRIGYGAGSREQPEPNVLRLWLGELESSPGAERLLVLEANIDDMPGELFGHAIERLLAAGALDAWCAPLTMKKSRPAALLGALVRPEDSGRLVDIILRETSTFGVRVHEVARHAVAREMRELRTAHGTVRVKLKILEGMVVAATPEYEDCRRRAEEGGVPLQQVYAAALAASYGFVGEKSEAGG